jgi:DNA polymerase-3 subunit epsilon
MQRSLDELGTPLHDVTFVVLDLETTGGSPTACAITEVGALKFRGGECLGTFQTLVNPGVAIPPEIVYLTGITEAMVGPAPSIEGVLPSLVEFIGDGVVVGHNVGFDMRFLQTNLSRHGYARLTNNLVDTCTLARRLVRDEVPDCKLRTLALHFRTVANPRHRAFDDACATSELLHDLLERAATLGVLALDDLLLLPSTARHQQVAKLQWVALLPRTHGVYSFKDGAGRVIYVGRATNVRRRVRSYFTSDDRRRIGPMLREAQSLDHVQCMSELESGVLEARLIRLHQPRYNRQVKLTRRATYLKLASDGRSTRLSIVRSVRRGDGCVYLGPLPSAGAARLAAEAIEAVVSLSTRVGAAEAEPLAGLVRRAFTGEPAPLLEALDARVAALHEERRADEATALRERAEALARAVDQQRRLHALVDAGRIVVEFDGGGAIIDGGRVTRCWSGTALPTKLPPLPDSPSLPLDREDLPEVSFVAAWLARRPSAKVQRLGALPRSA